MKALFLTPHSLNGFSGGTIATRNFLRVGKRVFNEITVVIEANSELQLLEECIKDYYLIQPRKFLEKIFYLLKGESIDRFSPGFEFQKLNIRDYSHLIIDNSILGRFAKIIKEINPSIFVITLHHNFERKFYSDSFSSIIDKVLINRVLDYNQKLAISNSNMNLMFTNKDMKEIEDFYGRIPEYRKRVFGFYEPITTSVTASHSRSSKKRLIITGNLSLKKGYVGIIDFVDEIFKKLDRDKFSLVIAGKDPVNELVDLCGSHENIDIFANPKSMQPLLQDADVYVNPCSLGSGIKIRNFDGLRLGLPVACNIGNSYGFEHYSEKAFSTFNSADTFLDAIEKLSYNKNDIYEEYISKNSLDIGVEKMRLLVNGSY